MKTALLGPLLLIYPASTSSLFANFGVGMIIELDGRESIDVTGIFCNFALLAIMFKTASYNVNLSAE